MNVKATYTKRVLITIRLSRGNLCCLESSYSITRRIRVALKRSISIWSHFKTQV